MVSVLVTLTSLHGLLFCISIEMKSASVISCFPVHPVFVFHPSKGELCQHSALLTRDSHLLVTNGASKINQSINPPLTALLQFPGIYHGEGGMTVHVCADGLVTVLFALLITTIGCLLTPSRYLRMQSGGGGRGAVCAQWCPRSASS